MDLLSECLISSCLQVSGKNINPLGVKGIGEIGITGTAAAIANAVYHATSKRPRFANYIRQTAVDMAIATLPV